ncbi:MAG: RNA 3'-terminal phosphate cyclase [bacterium]|nr:RNA 3'-terminal phosphate cyclase [bacterium]
MIKIDGGEKSGSGTILRYAVSLSSLLGKRLEMVNIRSKRKNPGLRPQHLKAVLACQELTSAKVEGAEVGSKVITFTPGNEIKGGNFRWDIGTAGSSTMLYMTILPLSCFGNALTTFEIQGGLFQDHAPSAFHMQYVLLPTLKKMGIESTLQVVRPGYVPKGGGIIKGEVKQVKDKIKALNLTNQGEIVGIKGISLASHLKSQKVSERMAEACNKFLKHRGYKATIEIVYDNTSEQAGASLFLYAKTSTGCIIGADMAGRPGRSSEQIGRFVAKTLLEDIEKGSTVDRYLADQLIIYAALASGVTEYRIPMVTDHVETNLWLVEKIIGAKTQIENHSIRIEGVGYLPK